MELDKPAGSCNAQAKRPYMVIALKSQSALDPRNIFQRPADF